jgi:hypothetical protein
MTAARGPGRFVATRGGEGLPAGEIEGLGVRSGSARNPTYFPLGARSFADFDWLVVLDAVTYNRGGPAV